MPRWLEALPDNQRDGTTAEALQAIVELDLSSFRRSNRHGVSAVIDQPDSPTGTTGKGHEDARQGDRPRPIIA